MSLAKISENHFPFSEIPFSGRLFHTLSHGVIRFVEGIRASKIIVIDAVGKFQHARRCFWELTLATKQITPHKMT